MDSTAPMSQPEMHMDDYQEAEAENIHLIAGERVLIDEGEDSQQHFSVHCNLINDKTKFDNMSPKARKAAIRHITDTLKAILSKDTQPASISEAGEKVPYGEGEDNA